MTSHVPSVIDQDPSNPPEDADRPRRRVIGITEQRLRARNEGSWMMSAKAWKKFMLGLTGAAKKKAGS
jgi:hypothetical protein